MCSLLIESSLHPQQMKNQFNDFMGKVQQLCQLLQLDLSSFLLDHIALRINDRSLAEAAHQAWLEHGDVLSMAEIHGRPIIVFALTQPLVSEGWSVDCLELPYPAEGKSYPQQGWEHVEFVVPSAAENAEAYQQDILRQFPSLAKQWEKLAKLGIQTKLSSPKGEGERLANPTLAFKWQGVCIKLHPHSLTSIIQSDH